MAMFCLENKAIAAVMQLESDQYFQGKHNIDIYVDEFRDLINMISYMDSIAIVLKFCQGLNMMTQDKIAESGTNRPQDDNVDSWFKAAC
jgi:hypothetical protein